MAIDQAKDLRLSESEEYVMTLLANGWVAVHTVRNEFRINNGEPQDMRIIDRKTACKTACIRRLTVI